MQFGIILSALLHCAILTLFLFGIPLPHKKLNTDYAITIDLVKPSEISNLKIANNRETSKQVIREVNAVPKASTERSEPKPEVERKEEKPQKIKQDESVDSEIIPKKKKMIEEEKKRKENKDEKKSKNQPEQDKKSPSKNADDFSKAILKSLEKSTRQQKQVEKKPTEKVIEEKDNGVKGDTNQKYKSDLPLSLSEIDAIKSEVTRHWNTRAFNGSTTAIMQVTTLVYLDPMGNIIGVKVEKTLNSSPSYHAFISSVVRAIKMSDFASILSPENYSSWHELELRFDSSGMIY